jgi:sugar lactone lactonase YvrE
MRTVLFILLTAIVQAGPTYDLQSIAGSDWVGDGGPAIDALLLQAEGIAADRDGTIYIADAQEHRVRAISSDGRIRTIAGTGRAGYSGDGGLATEARLSAPYGVAVDASGNIFIADLGNHRVRRVSRDGTITTLAATSPDGKAFVSPRNLTVDAGGNVIVADFDANRVYRITPAGMVSVIAGTGNPGYFGDAGLAVLAKLDHPAGLAIDRAGSLYIGDTQNHVVRKIDAGVIRTVLAAPMPTSLAFDSANTLYVADSSGGAILRVPLTGSLPPLNLSVRAVAIDNMNALLTSDGRWIRRITTNSNRMIAGFANTAYGDGGPATEARLNNPLKLAFDNAGNLYVTEDGGRIRKVTPAGTISTVPPSTAPMPADAPEDAQGNRYFIDGAYHIACVDPSGGVTFIETADPIALPTYVTPGPDGLLYVADAERDRVWKLVPHIAPVEVTSLSLGPFAPGQIATISGTTVFFNETEAQPLSNNAFLVPPDLPLGDAEITIRDGDAISAKGSAKIVAASPIFFAVVNQRGELNTANAGELVSLYGTGQGVEGLPLTMFVGGHPAEILYSGPVDAYPGLWQVNLRLPQDASGDVPIVALVGTAVSHSVTLHVN